MRMFQKVSLNSGAPFIHAKGLSTFTAIREGARPRPLRLAGWLAGGRQSRQYTTYAQQRKGAGAMTLESNLSWRHSQYRQGGPGTSSVSELDSDTRAIGGDGNVFDSPPLVGHFFIINGYGSAQSFKAVFG